MKICVFWKQDEGYLKRPRQLEQVAHDADLVLKFCVDNTTVPFGP
jgi:hypothetical protein